MSLMSSAVLSLLAWAHVFRVLERSADCWTSDSGGTMWIPSMPWNSGPALHSCRGTWWLMGVHTSGLHLLCGLEEGVWPCLSGHLVDSAVGIWGTRAISRLSQEEVGVLGSSELLLCFLWLMLFCWTLHVKTSNTLWDRLQPNAKQSGWESALPNLKPCRSAGEDGLPPQGWERGTAWSYSRLTVQWSVRLIGRLLQHQ